MDISSILSLHAVNSLGNRKLARLLDYFDHDAEAAWQHSENWAEALGLNPQQTSELLREKALINPEQIYENFCQSGASILTIDDEAYPQRLKKIYDPPQILYYKGSLPPVNHLAFAIIGSRQCTAYGRQAAEFLAQGLARAGAWVVSGLARGIDAAAHAGALQNQGKTIGVLGCGIDVIYPKENAKLFASVQENGCIITEYSPGTPPLAQHFPIRNRIISGLSDGVIVVEAKKQSGTQITVDYALEQGKELYAVPGPIFSPLSVGTHRLIRDLGVKPVANAEEVLADFGQINLDFVAEPKAKDADLSDIEKRLLDFLSVSRHFNEIVEELQISAEELAPLLTLCELRQYISQQPAQYYIRNNI